jgi:hypothetical protein
VIQALAARRAIKPPVWPTAGLSERLPVMHIFGCPARNPKPLNGCWEWGSRNGQQSFLAAPGESMALFICWL